MLLTSLLLTNISFVAWDALCEVKNVLNRIVNVYGKVREERQGIQACGCVV